MIFGPEFFLKAEVGDESDGKEEFCMNVVSDNYHTGGPCCTYKGRGLPCLVKLSEGGGISRNFLTKLLTHLDAIIFFVNIGEIVFFVCC